MPRFPDYVPHGVIPATLLALHDDGAIDEGGTRRHLRDVAATAGLSAITVNGHASEVHACTQEEQQRILDVTLDEIGDRLPVISGVWADGSAHAARIARQAALPGRVGPTGVPVTGILDGRAASTGDGDRPLLHDRGGHRPAADRLCLCRAQHAVATHWTRWCKWPRRSPRSAPSRTGRTTPTLHERQIRTLQGLNRPGERADHPLAPG